MDKPKSLSVKDFLIRKMSIKMNVPEQVIDTVVTHQFQSATQAFVDKNSVEISGLGKFLFNEKKAEKKLEKMHIFKEAYTKMIADDTVTEKKKTLAKLKLEKVIETIDSIKPKLNDKPESDIRGLEDNLFPSSELKDVIARVSKERLAICADCEWHSKNHKNVRPDAHCTNCGCTLSAKTKCLTCSCPLEKWVAALTEDQLQEIKNSK